MAVDDRRILYAVVGLVGLMVFVWAIVEVAAVIDPKGHMLDPQLSTGVSAVLGGAVALTFSQIRKDR